MIRPLTGGDAEELAALYTANRDFLQPFEPNRPDPFFTAEGQRERIARTEGTDAWMWAILEGDAISGVIALSNVLRGPLQMASIGYWVDREHNGRGLASAAVAEVVDFGFGEAALHRLEASTQPRNIGSQRVLEKNGFARFGYARKLLLIAGEWRDHVLFERVNG